MCIFTSPGCGNGTLGEMYSRFDRVENTAPGICSQEEKTLLQKQSKSEREILRQCKNVENSHKCSIIHYVTLHSENGGKEGAWSPKRCAVFMLKLIHR